MVHMAKIELANMQIKRVEKELRDTPHHKGTDHHIGRLRARLAKLKDGLSGDSSKGGGGGVGYSVKKQGDATVVLIGPPSVGKSTLINKLTNAQSKVAPYAFTTVSVIPGMLVYNNARIQILDVPGLIKGAEEGKGRGREVLSVVRGCDLLAFITDINDLGAYERITETLYQNGVRINQNPPNVIIDKKIGGGLLVHSNIKQDLARETIKDIAIEMGVKNADITLNEKINTDRLIDAFSLNRVYIPAIYILNKIDLSNGNEKIENHRTKYGTVDISAESDFGINDLKRAMWSALEFVNIYLVEPGQKPTFDSPTIMKYGDRLVEVAEGIGTEFATRVKSAKIWGPGSKFPGQEVSLSTKVVEGMQIQFI